MMVRSIIVVLSIIVLIPFFGRAERVDSLLTILQQNHPDSVKVMTYNQLFDALKGIRLDSAYQYAVSGLELSKANDLNRGRIQSHLNIGDYHTMKGQYAQAEEHYSQALEWAQKIGEKRLEAACYNSYGHVHINQSNYPKALEYYYKSLALEEELENERGIATAYNGIGNVLSYQLNYEEGLEFYFKSLDIRTKFNDLKGMASSYNGIGVVYNRMGKLEESKEFFIKSLQIKEELNDIKGQAVTNKNIGSIYYLQKDFETALTYYRNSLAIEKKLGRRTRLISSYFNMGIAHYGLQDFTHAFAYVDSSLDVAISIGSQKGKMQAYEAFSEMHESSGNTSEALRYFKLYTNVKDSIMSAENLSRIADIQAGYTAEKKKKENELLSKENDLQASELKRNKGVIIGLACAIVLIIVIVFLLLRNNRLAARQSIIELEKKVLRSQINPHFLFNSLNSIQNFFLNNEEKQANKYLSDFSQLMRTILDNSSKKRINLAEETSFIERYLSLEQVRLNGKFDFEIHADDQLDPLHAFVPPLIVQPFLENAVWHGIQPKEGKGHISVSFSSENEVLTCVVEDDGIGIEASKKEKDSNAHQSKGMNITQERLELLKGRKFYQSDIHIAEIKDEKGNPAGTRVEFKIPVSFNTQEVA